MREYSTVMLSMGDIYVLEDLDFFFWIGVWMCMLYVYD